MKIEKNGIRLYGRISKMAVDIVSFDHDWWYNLPEADEMLEPNVESEPLNEKGVLYCVRMQRAGELSEPSWVDSQGLQNIEDAIAKAESKVVGLIAWH